MLEAEVQAIQQMVADSPVIIAILGLPGAGKTTLANAYVAQCGGNLARVNKDELRRMLWGELPYSREQERLVQEVQVSSITSIINSRRSVVIDDAGLMNPKTMQALEDLASSCGVPLEVYRGLLSVPIEQCIAQDLQRRYSVGEAVIRQMAAKFLRQEPKAIDPDKPFCSVFDLDGCLSRMCDREIFDWDAAIGDYPIEVMRDFFNAQGIDPLTHEAAPTFILTGRNANGQQRQMLLDWLDSHHFVHGGANFLITREHGDYRPADEFKLEYLVAIGERYNISVVVDNDPRVCNMAASLGIPTVQPNFFEGC